MTVSQAVVLASGLSLVESPRWQGGALWFADWGPGEILRLQPGGGTSVVARAAAPPLSLDFLPDGRMLVVAAGERRIMRVEPGGGFSTYADLAGLPAAGWNEIVVDGRANAYVNGGNLEPMAEGKAPGLVALVTPDGRARQVADDIAFPNGMAVTPDNRTLIVAESWRNRLTAFEIAADGSLAGRRVWADVAGAPDGVCLDLEGACWLASVPLGRCLRVAEGGRVLDDVPIDRGAFACMLGGDDRRTLFITAARWFGMDRMAEMKGTGQVLAVAVEVPGAGWPWSGPQLSPPGGPEGASQPFAQ